MKSLEWVHKMTENSKNVKLPLHALGQGESNYFQRTFDRLMVMRPFLFLADRIIGLAKQIAVSMKLWYPSTIASSWKIMCGVLVHTCVFACMCACVFVYVFVYVCQGRGIIFLHLPVTTMS